jgi:hypothetical protein
MCDAELLAENEIKVNAPPKKRKDEFNRMEYRPVKVKSYEDPSKTINEMEKDAHTKKEQRALKLDRLSVALNV